MNNYDDAIKYIEQQEATDVSYVKIGEDNKKLIVSFASNEHRGFERKTSLMTLKYEHNNFDVLYLRNQLKWYLDGLSGIGKNINCTIEFLKKEFSKYDKVCCVGNSAGGFASLLFGSLLNANKVITVSAQTDVQYCADNLPNDALGKSNLIKISEKCPVTWNNFNKIASVLNNAITYHVYYRGDAFWNYRVELRNSPEPKVLHGDYHYDLIKHCPSVSKFYSKQDVYPLIEKFVKE